MAFKETLYKLNPAFMSTFDRFRYSDVQTLSEQHLSLMDRQLAVLASLIGSNSTEYYSLFLKSCLSRGLSPIAAMEVAYQSVAYVGYGKAYAFLTETDAVFTEMDIPLPLEDQATTTSKTRLSEGADVQVEIFGEQMRDFWKGGHMNKWLAENCFGDYYTRSGLTLAQREMITFCYLAGLGGCEPQLKSHVHGNMNLGNSAQYLRWIVSHCVPYLGYPRSLNALNCIQEVEDARENPDQK